MKKINAIVFKIILFIKAIYFVLSECDRDHPLLIGSECQSKACTNEELNNGVCVIKNEIIKTQWLNNIIYLGEKQYLYINLITSENNNLYCVISDYQKEISKSSSTRIAYILDNEGYGLFDKDNPKMYLTDENVSRERYESEIAIIKFNNDNKDYILSFSYPNGEIEIFDFHKSKIYLSKTLAANPYAVTNKLWVCFKLNSNDNENKYIIGLVESESFPAKYFFILKKVSFSSIDIANNPPEYETLKTESSDSTSISCYDMLNNYFACFILNRSFKYTMIVYSYDLIVKQNEVIAEGNSNEGYKILFFKCVHFFDETGAFGYFTNDEQPLLFSNLKNI